MPTEETRDAPSRPGRLRVLMVDDSASFCRVVGAALESEPDIEFRHCQDTSVALAVAAKFGPAVILQDMVMPGVDGLEMIRTYRRHLATEHLPVIVLSASSSVDQKTTAFLVGADDFVAKNAEHVELLARVRYHAGRYLAMQREGLHRHPMARGSRAHTVRLLVIEPTRVATSVLTAAFAREPDISARFCTDDRSALRLADEILPTVIVLSLFSGTYDGFELITRLRAKRSTHDVPIVFYTSTDNPVLKARALESGANDYVIRTMDTSDLVARVKRHSSLHFAARQARLAADATLPEDDRLRVLMVGENADLARDVEAMLHSERDLEFQFAAPTSELVALLRQWSPTVALLDLDMKNTDGMILLRTLRDDPLGEELPIVALSTEMDGILKARAFAHGVDDYVESEVDKIELVSRIRHHARAHLVARQLRRSLASAMDMQRRVEVQSDFIRRTFGRYLSDGVVDAILDDPDGLQLGGESRVVTLMMTDLRGFTALSETLPPTLVIEMLNGYFEVMTRVLLGFGATIDEFIGDAIFAVFGAPQAMPDHAERGIACAIAMQNAMVEVNEVLSARNLPPLEMGIGLNTGEVVVGNVGSERRTKFGVVGRSVNLASRVESYTIGGQILAADSTVSATGGLVRTRGSRTVEPKGIKEPVLIHDVVGIDGAHALHLVVTEEELAAPRTPLAFRAYVFEDKAKGAVALEGWVLRVSKRCALVASADPLELDKNLQLTLLSATGATLAEDVFAKVIRVNEVDGHYELRFTSLSAQARAVLSASVAAR
jgi:adenylate cyclase